MFVMLVSFYGIMNISIKQRNIGKTILGMFVYYSSFNDKTT